MAGIAIRHNLGWNASEGVFEVAILQYNAANMAYERVNRPSGLSDSRQVVAVTNTPIAIGSGACLIVWITALIGNSGDDVVVIGGSGVVHTLASRTGKALYPGDGMTIEIDNLSKIFLNGVAGDGISFVYTT